ncbi:MAG: HD domain-containing phosphohydrolase [Polyangiaceae bacterium]
MIDLGEPSTLVAEPEAPAALGRLAWVHAVLLADPRLTGSAVVRAHPLLVTVRQGDLFVLLVPAEVATGRGAAHKGAMDVLRPFHARLGTHEAMLVWLGCPAAPNIDEALNRGLSAIVPASPSADELFVAVRNAFELMEARARSESRGKWLNRYRYELGELIEIAKAITTERQIDRLLGVILEKSRFITGADAGSIYVVEGDDPDPARRTLRFKLSQNESRTFDSREFTMPMSVRSLAGFVALRLSPQRIDDVYDLPAGSEYGFDRSFDERTGYRTKSMLVAPLLSRTGEAIGVLQLINKKRDAEKKLLGPEDVAELVIPFDERSEALLMTLASQAGIALENAVLYEEIERMLEGFVRASVDAIEQRDPTTSGHSLRVAELTVGLARAVERAGFGPYKDVTFTKDDLRELSYASLLHDFGKIGVREQVLVKAKKLYPHELALIEQRFQLASRSLEADFLTRKMRLVSRGAKPEEIEALDRDFEARRAELTEAMRVVMHANEPTVLKGGEYSRIEALGRETYVDGHGCTHPLLTPSEVASLSIARGSLTPGEFDEIRSHVTHTFEFLSKIPWGKQFRRVAQIAGAHHERLNGTGYPNRLQASEIPLQSKMMSVADIFDALTASDRPYKRAVPLEKALDILGYEVKDSHLDADLVRIFTEAQVWTAIKLGS